MTLEQRIDEYVAAGKIAPGECGVWVEAAQNDRSRTFRILDRLPARYVRSDAPKHPVCHGKLIEPVHNILDEHHGNEKKSFDEMRDNWSSLLAMSKKRDAVLNENSFSAGLTTTFLIYGAVTQAWPQCAAIPMFSRAVSPDPTKPLATGEQIFNVTETAGADVLTNPTSWQTGDSQLDAVSISVSQYSVPFHVRNLDLNDGIRLNDLAQAKMASLGSKLMQTLNTNVTAANFSTLTPVIRSSANFGWSDMAVAGTAIKKARRKRIMLDGSYLEQILESPLFQHPPVIPGAAWENIGPWDYVALNTEWSTAGSNIFGLACDSTALAVIAGLPLTDFSQTPGILSVSSGTLPGVNVPIAAYAWFDLGSRTYWASYDIMFGAAALDTTIGCVIASGTPT
jgi:hypothetical protein